MVLSEFDVFVMAVFVCCAALDAPVKAGFNVCTLLAVCCADVPVVLSVVLVLLITLLV